MTPAIQNSRNVLAVAAIVSVLLSAWAVISHPLLNNDAFSYLRAAEIFNSSGMQPVLDEYGWYGYAVLIALADRLLPTDLLGSAYILNALAYILLTTSFIRLCLDLHEGPLIGFFAALTVLCFPLINEMRFMLIRDFAFWGFALLSLQQLIRFCRDGNTLSGIGWCTALLAAIFFRLEGILLLAVVVFLLTPRSISKGLKLWMILGGSLLLVMLLSLILQVNLPELIRFAYRYYLPLLYDLGTLLEETSRETLDALFSTGNFPGKDNTAHGLVIVLFAYVWSLFANLVNALGIPLTALILWSYYHDGFRASACSRKPLLLYMAFSALALFLFIVVMQFLTQRYATLLSLLLLTQIPALLQKLTDLAQAKGKVQQFRAALSCIVFYFMVDSLFSFGYSTNYIDESIAWTRSNIPADSRLHTNNFAVAYGSGLVEEYDRISRDVETTLQELASGDYLALDLKHDQQEWKERLTADSNLELLMTFSNTRADEIRIYRR